MFEDAGLEFEILSKINITTQIILDKLTIGQFTLILNITTQNWNC